MHVIAAEISRKRRRAGHIDFLLGNGRDHEHVASGHRLHGTRDAANEHVLVLGIARPWRLVVGDVPVGHHGGAEAAAFRRAGPASDHDHRRDRGMRMDVVDAGVHECSARDLMLGRVAELVDADEGIAASMRQGDAGSSMLGRRALDCRQQRAADAVAEDRESRRRAGTGFPDVARAPGGDFFRVGGVAGRIAEGVVDGAHREAADVGRQPLRYAIREIDERAHEEARRHGSGRCNEDGQRIAGQSRAPERGFDVAPRQDRDRAGAEQNDQGLRPRQRPHQVVLADHQERQVPDIERIRDDADEDGDAQAQQSRHHGLVLDARADHQRRAEAGHQRLDARKGCVGGIAHHTPQDRSHT